MAKIDTSHLERNITPVKNFSDFIGNGLPETPKLKSLVSSIKSVFGTQDNELQLYFVEGRMYCIDVFSNPRKIELISRIYYIPQSSSIYIYDENLTLIIQSVKKKITYSSIPKILQFLGVNEKFRNIISSIY